MTGFELITGVTVHIKFTYANTASSPTLSINNSTAKPIIQYGSTAIDVTDETDGWLAGAVLTLTYDGTSWVRDQGYNTNTTYTFSNGTNGFTVTPSNGSAQTITVTPDITNNITGSGTSGNLVKFNGANSITDGPALTTSYDSSTAVTTSHKFLREDGTWVVPKYTTNTDEKVTQNANTENKEFSILLKTTNNDSTENGEINFAATSNKLVTVNPSTGIITAPGGFNGVATHATADASGNTITTTYAPLASPALTGTPTAPTAANGTATTQIATTEFVNNTLSYANAMVFKGTLGSSGTDSALPAEHEAGWTYKVVDAGTYAGMVCQEGDLVICIADGTTATNGHWTSVQVNDDGLVTGPSSAIDLHIAVFDGTTGRLIQDGGTTIANASVSHADTAGAWSNDRTLYVDLTTADKTVTINGGAANASAVAIGIDGVLGVANGGTGQDSWTRYGIIYADTTGSLSQITAGTAGSPLIGKGSAVPAWYDGLTLAGSAAASYVATFSGTTDSASVSTGSIVIEGGVGIAKTLYVGTGANISGQTILTKTGASSTNQSSQLILANSSGTTMGLELWNGSGASWQIINDAGVLYVRNNYTTSQQTTYSQNGLIMDYDTGNIAFAGTVSIGQTTRETSYDLYVNGTSYLNSATSINGDLTFTHTSGSTNGYINWISGSSDTNQQRIVVHDETPALNAFDFQLSVNAGSTWTNLFRIFANGTISATTLMGDVAGNATTADRAHITQDSDLINAVAYYTDNIATFSYIKPGTQGYIFTSRGPSNPPTWESYVPETHGGTAQTAYVTGDILYASAANTLSRLSGNTSNTRKFLRMTGTGSAAAAPAWDTVTKTDVGLSNVTNDAQLPLAGGNMTGTLRLHGLAGTLSVDYGTTLPQSPEDGQIFFQLSDPWYELPAGGLTGQALIKHSANDRDVEWGAVGGVMTPSANKYYVSGSSSTTENTDPALFNTNVYVENNVLFGAAWNDYAEYRYTSKNIEPGRCVVENGKDELVLSSERMMPGAEIVSDTFGFAIGQTEKCKTPIAISGRVLAYPYENIEEFKPGYPVCSGPNGTVSIMSEDEARTYPWLILGTVSAIPQEETWGAQPINTKNRIWIRVR